MELELIPNLDSWSSSQATRPCCLVALSLVYFSSKKSFSAGSVNSPLPPTPFFLDAEALIQFPAGMDSLQIRIILHFMFTHLVDFLYSTLLPQQALQFLYFETFKLMWVGIVTKYLLKCIIFLLYHFFKQVDELQRSYINEMFNLRF